MPTQSLSWNSSVADFQLADEEEVVQYCATAPVAVGQHFRMKSLSAEVIAKTGSGLTRRDYDNQLFVWQKFNGRQFRVPEPYRYCERTDTNGGTIGHLLMQYLPGPTLAANGNSEIRENIEKAALAVQFLHTESRRFAEYGTRPGPPFGGLATGFPWSDYTANFEFTSVGDLENRVNYRLARSHRRRNPQWKDKFLKLEEKLCLCHLDLMPRNFILMEDGVLALVDWATLGWYPYAFEIVAISSGLSARTSSDQNSLQELARHSRDWENVEDEIIKKFILVQGISVSHAFPNQGPTPLPEASPDNGGSANVELEKLLREMSTHPGGPLTSLPEDDYGSADVEIDKMLLEISNHLGSLTPLPKAYSDNDGSTDVELEKFLRETFTHPGHQTCQPLQQGSKQTCFGCAQCRKYWRKKDTVRMQ